MAYSTVTLKLWDPASRGLRNPTPADGCCHFGFSLSEEQVFIVVDAFKASVYVDKYIAKASLVLRCASAWQHKAFKSFRKVARICSSRGIRNGA